MTRLRIGAAVLVASLVLGCLAGCGGGGKHSDAPVAPTGLGRITGVVSTTASAVGAVAAVAGRAGGVITVSVDGTNLSDQADQNGRFEIDNVPPGVHTLTASAGGGAQGYTVVVRVGSGEETNIGRVVLRDAGQISGLVTSAATGEAIPGAAITVVESVSTVENEMPHPVLVRRTDEHGSYTVSGLPVGDYVLTVDKDGFRSSSFPVSILAGSTTPGDVALSPAALSETGAVKGTVYLGTDDGRLEPLGGVLVILAGEGGPMPPPPLPPMVEQGSGRSWPMLDQYWAYSAPDGTYSIEGVPAGNHQAVAVRPGMEFSQREVTIVAGQATTADFTLTLSMPRFLEITGTVTSAATGRPIEGADVYAAEDVPPPPPMPLSRRSRAGGSGGRIILPDPGQCRMYDSTDANGHYRLLVPDSIAAVSVSKEGFGPEQEQIDNRTVIDFALDPAGTR